MAAGDLSGPRGVVIDVDAAGGVWVVLWSVDFTRRDPFTADAVPLSWQYLQRPDTVRVAATVLSNLSSVEDPYPVTLLASEEFEESLLAVLASD